MTDPVKLQVGKWYRRRDGGIVGPVSDNPHTITGMYPFKVGSEKYAATGAFYHGAVDERDIIEEVPAPIAQPDPPATKPAWQPINTAPKDGTEFLAYDSRVKKMDVCVWTPWYGGCVCQVQADGESGPNEDEFGYNAEDITHWRPLPEPPEGE